MALLRKLLLLLLPFFLLPAAGLRAATPPRRALPESIRYVEPSRVRAMRPLRKEHLGREIEFQVALRMRDLPKLMARIAAGEHVMQAELDEKYLPLPADYDAVVRWAQGEGLAVTQVDPMRLAVFVKGTIAQIQTATRAQFAEVTVSDGEYTSAVSEPSVPERVASVIIGLNGLQPHIHPHHIQSVTPQTANAPPYLVKEILSAYSAASLGYNGTGEKIAILIDTFPSSTDLTAFWSHNNIPQTLGNVEKVQAVSGALPASSGEETLDAEWTSGIASGAKIRIYATTDLSFTSLDKGFQRILSDLPTQTAMHELSISLGLGETEVSSSQKQTDTQYFVNIVNYGVSVFVSSGDSGATSDGILQPSYFSSDPNVTGVGGTTLYLYSTGGEQSESAWNGSGGGTSSFFSRPSWQTGSGVPAGSRRLVPDVSAAADPNTGAYVFLQGSAQQIGGTSWAAPMWAGFCAMINQARTQNGQGPIGLLNPKIYPLLGTSSFRDIISGNNGTYHAGIGYDEVTGIGSPVMSNLLPALASGAGGGQPQITSFAPVAGAIGMSATINGLNLQRVTEVDFNGTPARITATTSTMLTAVVPQGATTGPITLVSGSAKVSSNIDFQVVALPTNDAFANAILLTGTMGQTQGSNISATEEPGEPDLGGASVWWVWQAPDNGVYTFSTAGSSFDTTMGVFTGTNVASLSTTGTNDDYGTVVTSSVTFTATAGTIYHISVDGYQGANGAITLNWQENQGAPVISSFSPQSGEVGTQIKVTGANFEGTQSVTLGGVNAQFNLVSNTQLTVIVPQNAVTGPIQVTNVLGSVVSTANFVVVLPVLNDNYGNAQVITGPAGSVTGNNDGATKQAGEPNIAGNAGGKSIWYQWTASFTGPVTFTTYGSTFDTLLGIFIGDYVNSAIGVASNDDFGNQVTSSVTFVAQTGTTYHIGVDGKNGASGNVALNWSKNNAQPSISGFSPISGPPQTTVNITGTNFTGATSVTLGGVAMIYTVVSDALIQAVVPAGAGTGFISVGSFLGSVNSPSQFTVTSGPANDDFVNAIPLASAEVHATGANVGATRETGEPQIAGNAGGASVWWAWTAPSTGEFAISTQGSNFDTLLGVYTGASVGALSLVASNDDDPAGGVTSYVTISATQGTVYKIAVDGLNGASGAIDLSIFPQQATADLYSTGFEAKEGFVAGGAGAPFRGPVLNNQAGWVSFGSGGNGVVTGFDGMSGQQGYVGHTAPTASGDGGVLTYHPVNFTPSASEPIVTFTVNMAINDSTNFGYDDFVWGLFNSKAHNFFVIDFANEDLSVYYGLDGGKFLIPTNVSFANNTPMALTVTMDFANNKWSASLNGAPLVTNKPIRVSSAARLDFGNMAAAWQIFDTAHPGNNYMLFDDYSITAGEDPTPQITFEPQSQTVSEGGSIALGVVASGQAPLYYQWLFNKKPLPGQNASSLTIQNAQLTNAGSYAVQVSNAIGLITSQPAKIVVAPRISAPAIQVSPVSATVAAGATAIFQSTATGDPAPAYQWYFMGSAIPRATSPTLQLRGVQAANQGSYWMVASNSVGSSTSAQATLTVGSSFATQHGTFTGILSDGQSPAGLITVKVGPNGSFTGTLVTQGKSYRLAGALNGQGAWRGTVGKTKTNPGIAISLQLTLMGTSQLAGVIVSNGATINFDNGRDDYGLGIGAPPEKPAYTLTLTGTGAGMPAGIGFASLTVDKLGNVKATGRLADDTPFTYSGVLSGSTTAPFYLPLYKSGGSMGGVLAFQLSGSPEVTGTLHWARPLGAAPGSYPAFAGDVTVAGYGYVAPAAGQPVIGLGAQHTGTLAFSGAGLSGTSTASVGLNAVNALLVTGNSKIKLTVAPKTGIFTGSANLGAGYTAPFYGVLLQSLDQGAGLFEAPAQAGKVGITSP